MQRQNSSLISIVHVEACRSQPAEVLIICILPTGSSGSDRWYTCAFTSTVVGLIHWDSNKERASNCITTMLDVRRNSIHTVNLYCSFRPKGQLAVKMSRGDTFLSPHMSILSSSDSFCDSMHRPARCFCCMQ